MEWLPPETLNQDLRFAAVVCTVVPVAFLCLAAFLL